MDTARVCMSVPLPRPFKDSLQIVEAILAGVPPCVVVLALEAVDDVTFQLVLDRVRVCGHGDRLLEWLVDSEGDWPRRFFVLMATRCAEEGFRPLLGRTSAFAVDAIARSVRATALRHDDVRMAATGFWLATGITGEACCVF